MDPVSDYVQASLDTVLAIHDNEPPGDVLVFLTGQEEIDTLVTLLHERARKYDDGGVVMAMMKMFMITIVLRWC